MSVILAFSLLLLSTVVADNVYLDQKYDHFNVDQFINNSRLLKKYLNCFIDQGPCTPIGRIFKRVLPEVVRTACLKCTQLQKDYTKKTMDVFKAFWPEDFAALKKKYDPENKYFDAFEKAIAN